MSDSTGAGGRMSGDQASSDRLRTFLKRKYSLVHVPSRHKAGAWLETAQQLAAQEGLPAESAGLRAAKKVFPYECKEHALYLEGPVDNWLSGG